MSTLKRQSRLRKTALAIGLLATAGLALADPYRLLVGSRADLPSNDVFVATDNSYGDLIGSPAAVGGDASGIDSGPSYVATGFA